MTGLRRPAALMAAALALPSLHSTARAEAGSWQDAMALAERLSAKGKQEEAAKAAEGALEDAEKTLGPENRETIHILSRVSRFYQDSRDGSRLPGIEKRLSSIKSKDYEAWFALGCLRHFQEDYSGAVEALKGALAVRPDDADAEGELAAVDQSMGRDEDAIPLFEKALGTKPLNHLLRIQLANSEMRLGRYAEAKAEFARAKAIFAGSKDKSIDTYIAEGYFHLDQGESEQAQEAFEHAVALDSSSPVGYHHLGAYYSRMGRNSDAEKNLRRALELQEENPSTLPDDLLHTIVWLGGSIMDQGRAADAEAVFRKCLKTPLASPNFVTCLQSLGGACTLQGKTAEAEFFFKQAAASCEKGPSCRCRGGAMIRLAHYYAHQGRKADGLAVAEQVETLCSSHDTVDLLVEMELGGTYSDLRNAPKAESVYRRIIEAGRSIPSTNEAVPMTLGRLAEMDLGQGRFREAADLYRQAGAIWESRRDARRESDMLDGLAKACEKDGNTREADEARKKAEALRNGPVRGAGGTTSKD